MRRVLVLSVVLATALSLAIPAMAQPANDDLAAATAVGGLPFSDVVDTQDATTEADEPVEGEECPPRGSTVWYALTLGETQDVAIDTAGSNYDTTLAVYTGTDFSDLATVACNDDTFLGVQAALRITAEAGVTYLIQVGSFGGDGGGELHLQIAEPGRMTGRPVIFKSKFKGTIADAYTESFDEVTGEYSAMGATLVEGQSSVGGKPSRFNAVFVSEYTESFDEVNETYTVTQWFGEADLTKDLYEIDKKLRSAWVSTDVTLQGLTCSGSFEDEELECTELGEADVLVDISWDGVGGVRKSQFSEKGSETGIRFMSRGRFAERSADVEGGWSGDRNADLSGGFATLSTQSSGDFVMIRGASIP